MLDCPSLWLIRKSRNEYKSLCVIYMYNEIKPKSKWATKVPPVELFHITAVLSMVTVIQTMNQLTYNKIVDLLALYLKSLFRTKVSITEMDLLFLVGSPNRLGWVQMPKWRWKIGAHHLWKMIGCQKVEGLANIKSSKKDQVMFLCNFKQIDQAMLYR